MTYIKKLVMHGFKSFVRKTEIPFNQDINVVLGPNGSGKSNITDALCFVLGRLSIKSMRAAKASNLIFLGTKSIAPAKEAVVEITFDNSDKTFSIDKSEIIIKRIVRKNGLSIYKIDNEVKTRQEVLSLLSQAGIDPNGFNIILQGEIQNFVRMHTEERRKVIEEVSGISIYESRKEKSLKELEKTESRLNEILSILRERSAYLNNLEKERQQALKFKKFEEEIKRLKLSIISYDLYKKIKEVERINSEIQKKNSESDKIKKEIVSLRTNIENINLKISSINNSIQKSSGLEQEKLNQEIADIRAQLAGLNVRFENSEKKISDISRTKQDLKEKITNTELLIRNLQKESPTIAKKDKDIKIKKQELEKLEDERKRFYTIKSEFKSVKERLQDKNNVLQSYTNESNFLIKQIEISSKDLFDKNSNLDKFNSLKIALVDKKNILEVLDKKSLEIEKVSFVSEKEIERLNRIGENVAKMDVCPLCKSKITEGHVKSINEETRPRIELLKVEIINSKKELESIHKKIEFTKKEIENISLEISKRESDIIKLTGINEKKNQIKILHEKIEKIKLEISELNKNKVKLEKEFDENLNIEQKYESARVEMQEISLVSNENVDSEISFKQIELERLKISLKQMLRSEEDFNEELDEIKEDIDEREDILEKKRAQEEELVKKNKELIAERDSLQIKIRESESEIIVKQNLVYNSERDMNEFKIEKAKFDAEIQNLETEALGFPSLEVIKTSREILMQRLTKAQEIILNIGSVNLRSLEVYDSIKKEYETVKEKVDIISKEKEGIIRIINEIDIKKKKTFLKTLNSLNETFTRNFSELSQKGQVYLELENKKDPFEGGVGIVVKTGHGKYFDVASLSGGEQTIVALSLIFAIQELSPYCFYILDEIDAALDKRNSERLANLLKKHMKKGQYIVITHNDEIIANANTLYGISMHEGISKVVSLKV
ncbi:MAG: chromosome segregation SMC family protein [Nanoarchaeota archaeon]